MHCNKAKHIYMFCFTCQTMDRNEALILDALKKGAEGMSITELAAHVPLNRNSLARYLDSLRSAGMIRERVVGPAKLYHYVQDTPFSVQLELFKQAMDAASCGITIADARAADMPLIYVNEEFLHITGYSRDEVIGRNCRFLQGKGTDKKSVARIRAALVANEGCVVTMTNYRKDGAAFINELRIAPIRDSAGNVTHYVGVQTVR
jgi:PAS domain S-box-containing protein